MSIRTVVDRLLSLADEPSDDDDVRLRKRVGVLAGCILVAGVIIADPIFSSTIEPAPYPVR